MSRKISFNVYRSLLDSQTLFDFQSPIIEDGSVFNDTTLIYGQKYHEQARRKRIKTVTKRQAMNGIMPNYDYQMLFTLTANKNNNSAQYEINPSNNHSDSRKSNIFQQKPYICLNHHGRDNELPQYEIVAGDVLKLGNISFEVLQTHLTKKPEINQCNQMNKLRQQKIIVDNIPRKICKICLMQSEQNDDMVSPCDCKGSCQFVHFSCLQIWTSSKLRKQQNGLVSTYLLPKMQCQICKKQLPNKLQVNNKYKNLLQFNQPNTPYIIIQRLKTKGTAKYLYILKPNGRDVRIGRGIGMDLRLNDVSISRIHSSISFKDNRFYLKDEGSQFGSLILLKKAVVIEKIMCIQIGVKVLKFEQFIINPQK